MEDMKLVIKMPEWQYRTIKENETGISTGITINALCAIQQGTPLPKGHGAIKDVSQIEIPMCEDRTYERWAQVAIDSAPTIIEADKKYEAKVITRGNCMICGKELTEGLFFCRECESKQQKVRNKDANSN